MIKALQFFVGVLWMGFSKQGRNFRGVWPPKKIRIIWIGTGRANHLDWQGNQRFQMIECRIVLGNTNDNVEGIEYNL